MKSARDAGRLSNSIPGGAITASPLDVPLAVGSSATTEDSAQASFVGIHSSALGKVGLEAVYDSIRAGYASLWTPRAVGYRRRIGLSDTDVLCAVVLCRMVGADGDPHQAPTAAGVAFSCDPRRGRRDVVTVVGRDGSRWFSLLRDGEVVTVDGDAGVAIRGDAH